MSLTLKKVSNPAESLGLPADDDEPHDSATVDAWRTSLAAADASEILQWALGRWPGRIALCTAFQAEGSVLLDMAWRINPNLRVMTLDTGRLPQETHDLIERVRWRYGIRVEVHTPDSHAVDAMMSTSGPNLFYHSVEGRQACCHIRKVAPLKLALKGFSAWITGLRREQASSRAGVRRLEIDPAHGNIVKLNPLADWTHEAVWTYLRTHDVPFHPLYDQGYTSIGCTPCTRPVEAGQDQRSGRWWWEAAGTSKECGLHFARPEASLDDASREATEEQLTRLGRS